MLNKFKLLSYKKWLLVVVFTVFVLASFVLKDEFMQEDFDDHDELSHVSVERKHVSVPSSRGYQGYSFESVITGNKTGMFYEAEQSSDEKNVPITMSEREENTEDVLVRTVS